jgi:DNA-binding transcriptional LysR family regulator
MNVNFEHYKLFYYVAKYKNITQAARAIGSSQPNLTRAINCLENETGCTLFIRTNRGVTLTPEGKQLYGHVSAAMVQLETAERELSEITGLVRGSISIGVTETALNIFLLAYIKAFRMEYPGIRLRISNHSALQAVQAAKNGEVDFAVVTTPVLTETPLIKVPLQTFQEILIGGKTFSSLEKQELSLKELADYPLISLARESMTWKFYHDLFLSQGLELDPDTEAAATDQILPLVKSELGLAFIPEPMAREALAKREIVAIPLRDPIPKRQVCMVYDPQHPMSTAARNLQQTILGTI